MKLDYQPVISHIHQAVEERQLNPGEYSRYLPGPDAVPNEYGCADAANILYSIGKMERDPARRAAAVRTLQNFQNPETGLFEEGTHHPFHTTAHCIAALELFDAGALYPVAAMRQYLKRDALCAFLDQLDWSGNPWNESHRGAGLYSALTLTGETSPEWSEWYFGNLDAHTDPVTGISRKEAVATGKSELCRHLAGHFHYLFCYLHARRAFPCAEKLIDSCITLYREDKLLENFGRKFGFLETDWVFTLHRATRQTPYRFNESRSLLRDFAEKFRTFLVEDEWKKEQGGEDLHALFGTITAVAELQLALPGEILTDLPLKNVLDRRPFI